MSSYTRGSVNAAIQYFLWKRKDLENLSVLSPGPGAERMNPEERNPEDKWQGSSAPAAPSIPEQLECCYPWRDPAEGWEILLQSSQGGNLGTEKWEAGWKRQEGSNSLPVDDEGGTLRDPALGRAPGGMQGLDSVLEHGWDACVGHAGGMHPLVPCIGCTC